ASVCNAAFVNLPSIYHGFSRGGDAEAHLVAPNVNDGEANIAVNDDLFAYFAREHKHSSPPWRKMRREILGEEKLVSEKTQPGVLRKEESALLDGLSSSVHDARLILTTKKDLSRLVMIISPKYLAMRKQSAPTASYACIAHFYHFPVS